MDVFQPITITASKTLDRDTYSGVVTNLSAAAGLTVTLPASTGKGDKYELFCLTTVTSNNYVIAAAGSDIIQGVVGIATDVAGVTCPTTATSDKMTLNGGTTGGILGSRVVLEDVSAGIWAVSGALISTTTEATPFSAS